MSGFVKVRFTGRGGATAGLVIADDDERTVADLSRMFPYSESNKMQRFERSPAYETFDEAFRHTFPDLSEQGQL